jgi:hypothetical protein
VSVEVSASFGAVTDQFVGLATNLSAAAGNYWAGFTTAATTNSLFARLNRSGTITDVRISALPTGFHTYRVTPIATGFQFYVDGVLARTISSTVPAGTPFRMAMSALKGSPSAALSVDSIRLVSTATTGTLTSLVFDSGRVTTWGLARWTANLPAGTSVLVEARSGNTAAPDGTWSAWRTLTNGGATGLSPTRYIQYRITLTTTNAAQTPTFLDLTLTYS